jgi:filamentous hemagglutinin family protein
MALGVGYLGLIGGLVAWSLSPAIAVAQIVPDGSLGAERSRVSRSTIQGLPADLIDGGARRGTNLFHSFRDFNIGDRQRVYFADPAGVTNILTRVTGTNASNILGTLGVNGPANLYLLNPNGILFGPNACLDIRGSLMVSTADSLNFDNGFRFSASNPQTLPLLTVNVPIGLQFGPTVGDIRMDGAKQTALRECADRVAVWPNCG